MMEYTQRTLPPIHRCVHLERPVTRTNRFWKIFKSVRDGDLYNISTSVSLYLSLIIYR